MTIVGRNIQPLYFCNEPIIKFVRDYCVIKLMLLSKAVTHVDRTVFKVLIHVDGFNTLISN